MNVFRLFSFALLYVFISADCDAQQYVFKEEFDTQGSLPKGNTEYYDVYVANGKYFFEHKDKYGSQTVDIGEHRLNQEDDFEMEISFQKIDGLQDYGMSFLYELKDVENYKEFSITSTGFFRVGKSIDDSYRAIQKWKESSAINQGNGANNKLKIKKVGNEITFFINEVSVYSMAYQNYINNQVSFRLYRNQKIAIDYVRVKRLIDELDDDTVLYDGFTDNSNQWDISNDSKYRMNIKNGDYVLEHRSTSGGMVSTIPVYMEKSKSYTIKTKIKQITGTEEDTYALVFQKKDDDNNLVFNISTAGFYGIYQIHNGEQILIQKWKLSPHIKKGKGVYNHLKVVKEGYTFKFYVNDHLLTNAYSSQNHEKSDIGFILYGYQKISVGFLSVKYSDRR